jgi:hypothetical protein
MYVFVFAFASEIGPDFSPDIQELQRFWLQPLGYALFFTGMGAGRKESRSQGLMSMAFSTRVQKPNLI